MAKNSPHGYRKQVKIWLDHDKPEQRQLSEDIDRLKSERRFSTVFRQAMQLFLELESGKTDLLFELFPHLEAQVSSGNSGNLSELQQSIKQLQQALLSGGSELQMKKAIAQQALPVSKPALQVEKTTPQASGKKVLHALKSGFKLNIEPSAKPSKPAGPVQLQAPPPPQF